MRTVTKYVTAGIIVALLIYDIFAIHFGGTESSVSQIIIEWSYAVPAFTFSIGFIMGHLFWRLRDNSKTNKLGKDQE
jgi:ABC-type polysaccharide/polyol phosphate export permease